MGNLSEIQYGVVIFDDQHVHQSGWACIAQGEPFRITGTQDLQSDVCWISNLDYQMMMQTGMSNHARFRRRDFFRMDLYRLGELLGARDDDDPEVARLVANLFRRVMRLHEHMDAAEDIPVLAFRNAFRPRYFGFNVQCSEAVTDAIRESIQYFTPVERSGLDYIDDYEKKWFYLPRIAHAQSLIDVDYPFSDQWHKIPGPRRQSAEGIKDWAERIGTPFLAQIRILKFDPRWNQLVNFGAMPAFKGKRQWVTHHELELLLELADVEVAHALACEDLVRPSQRHGAIFYMTEAHEISTSAAVYCENAWTALGAQLLPRGGRARQSQRAEPINPATPFVRALDRRACFHVALKLQELGIDVTGYGTGAVSAQVRKEMPADELTDIVRQADVLPTFSHYEQLPPFPEGQSRRPVNLMQELLLTGSGEKLEFADERIIAGN